MQESEPRSTSKSCYLHGIILVVMTDQAFIERYSSKLNDQQLEAVRTIEGPVLLLAVPGSGKTTVLVNRLGYMLYVKKIPAENILTLTYTVAATRDMAERFERLFGKDLLLGLIYKSHL